MTAAVFSSFPCDYLEVFIQLIFRHAYVCKRFAFEMITCHIIQSGNVNDSDNYNGHRNS